MLRALYYEPYIVKKTTIDTFYGLVGLMDSAYKAASDLRGSSLVLFGEKDEFISKKAFDKFKHSLPKRTNFREYSKGYHLLLRDLNRVEVTEDIIKYIKTEIKDQMPSASNE